MNAEVNYRSRSLQGDASRTNKQQKEQQSVVAEVVMKGFHCKTERHHELTLTLYSLYEQRGRRHAYNKQPVDSQQSMLAEGSWPQLSFS